jgi:hypothetical protein
MIELIQGLPDGVVGFEAVGTVTADDYESVVAPAVADALATHDTIRLMHVFGERLEHHTPGALWEDTKLGLSRVRSFERIAVVTDLEPIRALVHAAGWAVPGQMRLFSNAARGEAETWVAEENEKGDDGDG